MSESPAFERGTADAGSLKIELPANGFISKAKISIPLQLVLQDEGWGGLPVPQPRDKASTVGKCAPFALSLP